MMVQDLSPKTRLHESRDQNSRICHLSWHLFAVQTPRSCHQGTTSDCYEENQDLQEVSGKVASSAASTRKWPLVTQLTGNCYDYTIYIYDYIMHYSTS